VHQILEERRRHCLTLELELFPSSSSLRGPSTGLVPSLSSDLKRTTGFSQSLDLTYCKHVAKLANGSGKDWTGRISAINPIIVES
jgi:hypothetical protein